MAQKLQGGGKGALSHISQSIALSVTPRFGVVSMALLLWEGDGNSNRGFSPSESIQSISGQEKPRKPGF